MGKKKQKFFEQITGSGRVLSPLIPVVTRTGHGKKENEQDAALIIIQMLYQQGKFNDQGEPELKKQDFKKRIKECQRAEGETTNKRWARLEDLDEYGLYFDKNAPTRQVLLDKSLFKFGSNKIEVVSNQMDKAENNKQYEARLNAEFDYPVASFHKIHRFVSNPFRLENSKKVALLQRGDSALSDIRFSIHNLLVVLTATSVDQKKAVAEKKCIMRFVRQMYQMGFVEPYVMIKKEVYPLFYPEYEYGITRDLINLDRFKKRENGKTAPWHSLSRIHRKVG